ncbi:helix-turn-helix transcriptional regulator [Roseobacter sp. HKCCA0882]|uniref:helix-turn-helix transcriptional regulator n=1 Tax=Roseobacter sp. HKCCA0882 TaxID=3120337 RepID=UPI004040AB91
MRILKAKEVSERTSISIPHIRRMAREDRFPKPLKISDHRSGWLESEVLDWISECVRKHRQQAD